MCEVVSVDFSKAKRERLNIIVGDKDKPKLTKDGRLKMTPNNFKKNRDNIQPYKEVDIERMCVWLDKQIMESQNDYQEFLARRNKAIFLMGCNCGLRVSDLCSLRWSDVFDDKGKLRLSKIITPKKTANKNKHIELEYSEAFRIALIEYIETTKTTINHDYVKEVVRMERKLAVLYRNLATMKRNKTGKYSDEDIADCKVQIADIEDKIAKFDNKLWVFPSRKGGHIKENVVDIFIKKGKKDIGIDYPVATHSLRKSYARIKYEHATDKTQAITYIREIFGHSSEAVTMRYIGIRQEEIRDFTNQTPIGVDVEANRSLLEKYM